MKLRWLLLVVVLVGLLVPALTLTYARMLDPVGGTWVRLVAFTPLALGFYALALLVTLLGWWRTWGVWRVLLRTLALALAVAIGVHAWWASGPYLGTVSTAGGRSQLRVMTANLMLGQAAAPAVVQAAVSHGADVLVLEEVTPEELQRLEDAGLRTAFPHRTGAPAEGAAGTMVLSTRPLSHATRLRTGFGSWRVDVRTDAAPIHVLGVHARPPVGDGAD